MGNKHLIGGTVDNATDPKGHGNGHVFKFTIEKVSICVYYDIPMVDYSTLHYIDDAGK